MAGSKSWRLTFGYNYEQKRGRDALNIGEEEGRMLTTLLQSFSQTN